MRISMRLAYDREPEIVALRFNPMIDFNGLVKTALRAYINNEKFHIELPSNPTYIHKSLRIAIYLNDDKDANIVDMLKQNAAPNTAFIRNLLIRSIEGDLSKIYNDVNLKELALKR